MQQLTVPPRMFISRMTENSALHCIAGPLPLPNDEWLYELRNLGSFHKQHPGSSRAQPLHCWESSPCIRTSGQSLEAQEEPGSTSTGAALSVNLEGGWGVRIWWNVSLHSSLSFHSIDTELVQASTASDPLLIPWPSTSAHMLTVAIVSQTFKTTQFLPHLIKFPLLQHRCPPVSTLLMCMLNRFSRVWLFSTPWIVAWIVAWASLVVLQ